MKKNSISILGSGWYGTALGKSLADEGWLVNGSTTRPDKMEHLKSLGINPFLLSFEPSSSAFDPAFFDSSILVICIPPGRATGNQDTYLPKIRNILKAASFGSVTRIILISSTSVYGDLNTSLNEDNPPSPVTASGKALLDAETVVMQVPTTQTTIIRFGGLVGPGRDPGRFFSGKTSINNGLAPVNLIHLDDCVGITRAVIEQEVWDLRLNAVAPHHPTRADFYTLAARKSGLPAPRFIAELCDWKIVTSKHIPDKLNYSFKISDWNNWLIQD
ncbi:SDR family oxidoreductase [Pedobacter deserti]|uniref:SDR family oxidoreductase n=1 Tax=Pedobacter deserti TaxID=2817382 RepID=UPI002108D82E|nr:SDR family oxidoreductase [Pedobacter sp. SYSU D00382]